MTEPVALETPRLILRELRDDDAPAIHAYAVVLTRQASAAIAGMAG